MKRLACLLFLGAALAATGALAKVTGAPDTVAVVSPPITTIRASGGCTPINPCAVATPVVSDVALPAPTSPPQPDVSAGSTPAAPAAPQTPAAAPRAPAAAINCPPPGRFGRGEFAGRGPGTGPNGQASGLRGGRGGSAARGGEGRGRGPGGVGAGRGQQFAQNFQGARGQGRGPDGCPPDGRGQQGARGGNSTAPNPQ